MSSYTVEQLQGVPQQYAWGKLGRESMVAKLCASGDVTFTVDENQPYAELWMGTHVKAPSKMVKSGEDLKTFVAKNLDVLGAKVQLRFKDLPYLFKVLSVAKALSIQAHPDKKLAEKLHAERPEIYKDPNHKPEMAIALTEFEALCGFRPVNEILKFFELIPELTDIIGNEACEQLKSQKDPFSALKSCFSKVIQADKALIQKKLTDLVKCVSTMEDDSKSYVLGDLLLRLNHQFPGDVGCFVIYFLNHVHLQPGEALFLKANVPHAYLDGDCIECMACSDNVVRAGLTPKLIDAETLIEMLEYKPSSVAEQLFRPVESEHAYETLYNPPVDDFTVSCVKLSGESLPGATYEFSMNDSASIVLFIEASARVKGSSGVGITAGTILFIPAGVKLEIENVSEALVAYRASCLL